MKSLSVLFENKEIINFIKVGIVNTIFYYLMYGIFIFLGFDYKIAVLFANLIGVLFNFKTFSKYVFYTIFSNVC